MEEAAAAISSAVKRVNSANMGMPRNIIAPGRYKMCSTETVISSEIKIEPREGYIHVRHVMRGDRQYVADDSGLSRTPQGLCWHSIHRDTGEIIADHVKIDTLHTEHNGEQRRFAEVGYNAIRKWLDIARVESVADVPWEYDNCVKSGEMLTHYEDGDGGYCTKYNFGKIIVSRVDVDDHDVLVSCDAWTKDYVFDVVPEWKTMNNEWMIYGKRLEGPWTLVHRDAQQTRYSYDIVRYCGHIAIGIEIDYDTALHRVYWHAGNRERMLIGEFVCERHWEDVRIISWRIFLSMPHWELFVIC